MLLTLDDLMRIYLTQCEQEWPAATFEWRKVNHGGGTMARLVGQRGHPLGIETFVVIREQVQDEEDNHVITIKDNRPARRKHNYLVV